MCRIAGIVSKERLDIKTGIEKMLFALRRGGPDHEGIHLDEGIGFGHRRLSIIDLSAHAHQPMSIDDDQLVISYNGEIYNYATLRIELEQAGIRFKTHSDTEVILYAYQCWGVESFKRMEGIFAFSLHDKKKNKVILVRDHIGVKPLYYHVNSEGLTFASEVRAFRALRTEWPENEEWCTLFLAFGFIPEPVTTLDSVLHLSAGSFLTFNLNDYSYEIERFYPDAGSVDAASSSLDESLQSIREGVEDALRKNMVADAPIGIFLSGGIDSSLLTLLADQTKEEIHTVSVNFAEASFDERPFQDIVLNKTHHVNHHSFKITESAFWENLNDIWTAMDQPSVDGINTFFVSQCAHRAGLKSVLSGVGADELFGGYTSFDTVSWISRLRHLPLKKSSSLVMKLYKRQLERIVFLSLPGPVGDYLLLRGIHTPEVIAKLLQLPEEKVWDTLRRVKVSLPSTGNKKEYASQLESKIYLKNQLLRDTDVMSMWHGLEVRAPFLDIRLIEKVSKIAPAIRYSASSKFLLTESHKDVLPRQVVERKKAGFTFPFELWMRRTPERFAKIAPDNDQAREIISDFYKGRNHWSKYWTLIVMHQLKSSQ